MGSDETAAGIPDGDAFGALNPLRETPVLELDDGTVLTQSPAILTYLAEETPLHVRVH